MGRTMMVALQHACLQWLAHLLLGSAAILLGPWPALGWGLLAVHVGLQWQAARWLRADVEAGLVRRPRALATVAHAPALLLSLVLALGIAGAMHARPMLMVHLQWWTAPWDPLLALLPPGGRRNLYVWATLLIPVAEWLLLARMGTRRLWPARAPAPASA